MIDGFVYTVDINYVPFALVPKTCACAEIHSNMWGQYNFITLYFLGIKFVPPDALGKIL